MPTQRELVEALMKPEAYDEDPGQIQLIQTHISFVFLTRTLVYKVKKAVDLGFLDFTTLEKRRFFCEKELELNRRLCEKMYLEVVPINRSDIIKIKGKGETIEYAVKMKKIPQEKMMSNLLEKNRVDFKLIGQIARIIAGFHSKIQTDRRRRADGSLITVDPIVETNWRENFAQTKEFIGETISMKNFKLIREIVKEFMRSNLPVFEKRMVGGKVRDCHGDIHSGNIFIADQIYIFDAIEFNDRIRYSDVTADIGFLAMDLDLKNRSELSKALIKRYVEYSGDQELMEILPFYKCYRAYVRGKVTSFKLKDPSINDQEKAVAIEEAKAYFKLAAAYAKTLTN